MKQKRTFVTLLLVIAILCLGIAYAIIDAKTLTIGGNVKASPDAANFVVKFVDAGTAEVTKGPTGATATAAKNGDTGATLTVEGFTAAGDTATATWTIINESPDLLADISIATSAISDNVDVADYFEITTTVDGITEDTPKTRLDAVDGTTTVTVTVELVKTPVDTEVTGTIDVQLTADPIQPSTQPAA